MAKSTKSFAVNELGEIVATSGVGSSNIVGYLPSDYVSTDNDGRLVLAMQGNEDAIFSSLLMSNGAKLDGITDDSAAFQASINALSTLTSGRISVSLPTGKTIKLNSGLTFDIGKVYLDGKNCKLDFSGMTSGTAITLTGTAYDKSYGGVMGGLAHLHIKGSYPTNVVDGILFTGDTTPSPANPYGSARSVVKNCVVESFQFGVTFWHRAYLSTLDHCEIYRNRVGIYSKGLGVDAYENVSLLRGAVYNNDMNIYVEEGHIVCNGTSIDYANIVQMAIRNGSLLLNECHVEYTISKATYGQNNGAIYSGNAPLCAIDLMPGNPTTINTGLGLAYTTPSVSPNGAYFRMSGGLWVVTAPQSTAANTGYVSHIHQGDQTVSTMDKKVRMHHQNNVPTSGYMFCKLSAWNVGDPVNTAGTFDFEPAMWNEDITHIAQQGAAGAYMTTNPLIGYSVSPLHNLAGSFGANYSALGGFEGANMMEDICITVDTATITDRQTGTNGSYVRTTSDGSYNGGSGALKLTKVGAATTPLKIGMLFPRDIMRQRRPVVRMAIKLPASGAATTGSFNVNIKGIKPEFISVGAVGGETIFRPVNGAEVIPGGSATSGSGVAAFNPSQYKSTGGSAFSDNTTMVVGTWYPLQIAGNIDRHFPAWMSHIVVEFDLTAMGSGSIIVDAIDIQWM